MLVTPNILLSRTVLYKQLEFVELVKEKKNMKIRQSVDYNVPYTLYNMIEKGQQSKKCLMPVIHDTTWSNKNFER